MAPADSDNTTAKAPAFQFYAKDFVTGTLTFSTEEVGAYILLLAHCWDHGFIPADIKLIARIARLTPSRMRGVWVALAPKFQATGTGEYIQPRLERERDKQAAFRAMQSEKGRRGGRPHKAEEKPRVIPGLDSVKAEPKPEESSSISYLQSSSSDFRQERARPKAVTGGGAGAGSNPRDHLYCRGNGTRCSRICVSEKQHAILRAKFGGDERTSDDALDAFYAEVRSRLDPNQPIGDTPWKFWDAQFAAKFGTVAGSSNPRTAGNLAAAARFVARGNQ